MIRLGITEKARVEQSLEGMRVNEIPRNSTPTILQLFVVIVYLKGLYSVLTQFENV